MALALDKPVFVSTDPQALTAEMIAWYEKASGKTLYPAQDERLLINLIAYRENLVRVAIQDTAEQNLVALARAPMLDYLGELVGVYRLAAQSARTTLRFSVDVAPTTPALIPAGTRVSATDSIIFTTDADVILNATTTAVEVKATCSEPGVAGNGWQPAQISTLLDEIGNLDLTVTNTAPSSGGADQEDDDRLRERITLAPESFSNAGSRQAYRFHAMSAHQNISDVAVVRPVPGTVNLYPLLTTGMPDETLLALVKGFCSDEKVRPLTDTVNVLMPGKVDYRIRADIWLYANQDAKQVMAQANKAAEDWTTQLSTRLGRDIVPSQISAALSVPGVYQVNLAEPTLREVAPHEWPHCTGINLTLKGIVND
ncbi:TPA: baseplate J/gp47 family protein [Klebsiella pneumoniae]|nr:baseplate J/gp47 family protein [Klebsiella pneumoniae]